MPEPIAQWWARRQTSRGATVPYPVGTYRESWQSYPMLVRQYHPEFNGGIVLSQIPPAADVYLCWQCEVGHLFVATPTEQRLRPGRERRRSSWCPECLEAASPRTPVMPMREGPLADAPASPLARLVQLRPARREQFLRRGRVVGPDGPAGGGWPPGGEWPPGREGSARHESAPAGPPRARRRGGATGEPTVELPGDAPATRDVPATSAAPPSTLAARPAPRASAAALPVAAAAPREAVPPSPARGPRRPKRPTTICSKTPLLPAGEPFASVCAPSPASAVEGELRAALTDTLEYTTGLNAIRLARPFFDHLEAWPDVILPELRVVIEYDSTGRFGLEHVGHREEADRRKDRAIRGAGWEVIRIRTGRLPALGPHDLQVAGLSKKAMAALVDELRTIRGALIVDCYLRVGP